MSPNPSANAIQCSVSQAQLEMAQAIQPINETHECTLQQALNRVTACDVIATINVPAFDNSAMDGYAFCAQDLSTFSELRIVGSALAGHPFETPLTAGQAIRITTGAQMPTRCDTVLPQELAQLITPQTLNMRDSPIQPGQHRRRRGEDISQGAVALPKGCRLGPAELGLLASLGHATVSVQRTLKIAIFSTGDELRSNDHMDEQRQGLIYDSNRVTLYAMLTRMGVDVIDLGILPDNPQELEYALSKSVHNVDAIITSGGVAAGAADYTKQVFQRLGEMHFWSINMRPGRPLAFGRAMQQLNTMNACYLFGLPGNPVAVMVSFYFFVRPALQLLAGEIPHPPMQIKAIAAHAIAKKIGRTEFQRGYCYTNEQGQLKVHLTGAQGSGILSSMSKANCMVVLTEEQSDICADATINVVLFEGLI